ncbi:hypothetical protein J8TS2_28130 [Lederbergia ruris]|uniref:Uncharacterized protein n=1 Tax=Lederbergia ruris TaxID=217495 RepID=A0ABQ4KMW5_9BACI|nr:hypothetical protein [Lederbergia ruris]GIN58494.1 hypothetical protein J8TS2_28130 [Lederbergia ruris]
MASIISDYLLVLITLLYSVFTWQMLKANKEMVKESQRNREVEYKPEVILYFDEGHVTNVLNLVVKNIGRGITEDVRIKKISSNIPLDNLSEVNFFNKSIRMLAPQQKIEVFVGMFPELIDENGNFPTMELEVEYRDKFGKTYIDNYVLDSNMYKGIRQIVKKSTHDIAKEMKELNKNIIKIHRSIND